MTRLLVSLDVMSDSLTLEELTRNFGFSLSENSFSRGEIDDLGRTRKYSLLRFESPADEGATCDEHIATLKTDIDRIDAQLDRLGRVDVSLLLNIGVLFTTAYGSVEFATVILRNASTPLRVSNSACPVADSDLHDRLVAS
jgi:hypothetical protein